jgi:hypothetical protein
MTIFARLAKHLRSLRPAEISVYLFFIILYICEVVYVLTMPR